MQDKLIDCGADPVAMAALNEAIEAWMDAAGPKASRAFLKSIAARAASPIGMEPVLVARGWLQGRLPSWMSRFG